MFSANGLGYTVLHDGVGAGDRIEFNSRTSGSSTWRKCV